MSEMSGFKDVSDKKNKFENSKLAKNLDKEPANKKANYDAPIVKEKKDIPVKMQPPIVVKFKCSDGMNRAEFTRQTKGQERGLNSLSMAEFMKNCMAYQERKEKTGNGRALEGVEAQKRAREKALQSRIASNVEKKNMSYKDAKNEAESWLKTQAALHNPDQIAGGNPGRVSRMGDAKVNASIGSQWRSRVEQIRSTTNEFAKGYSNKELEQIKMNVRLEVE